MAAIAPPICTKAPASLRMHRRQRYEAPPAHILQECIRPRSAGPRSPSRGRDDRAGGHWVTKLEGTALPRSVRHPRRRRHLHETSVRKRSQIHDESGEVSRRLNQARAHRNPVFVDIQMACLYAGIVAAANTLMTSSSMICSQRSASRDALLTPQVRSSPRARVLKYPSAPPYLPRRCANSARIVSALAHPSQHTDGGGDERKGRTGRRPC